MKYVDGKTMFYKYFVRYNTSRCWIVISIYPRDYFLNTEIEPVIF